MAALRARIVRPRVLVHRGGAGEEVLDVEALKRRGHQPDRAHHRRAASDPIEHRKPRKPPIRLGIAIQLALDPGHGDGVFAEVETHLLVASFRFEHAVAGFLRAAGF